MYLIFVWKSWHEDKTVKIHCSDGKKSFMFSKNCSITFAEIWVGKDLTTCEGCLPNTLFGCPSPAIQRHGLLWEWAATGLWASGLSRAPNVPFLEERLLQNVYPRHLNLLWKWLGESASQHAARSVGWQKSVAVVSLLPQQHCWVLAVRGHHQMVSRYPCWLLASSLPAARILGKVLLRDGYLKQNQHMDGALSRYGKKGNNTCTTHPLLSFHIGISPFVCNV